MRNILSGIALSLVFMLALTGCDKDNATLLTEGVWTFQDLTTDSENETVISIVSLAKALLTDATMEFQEGGTYIMDSPLVENSTTGEWQLIGDETPSTSNIETLTKDKLSYSETFVDGQMNTYVVTTTWVR